MKEPHSTVWTLHPIGSYLQLIDSCITHLKAQGPSRTSDESKEEETVFQVSEFVAASGGGAGSYFGPDNLFGLGVQVASLTPLKRF